MLVVTLFLSSKWVHSKSYKGQVTMLSFSCEGFHGDSTNTGKKSQFWYMGEASLTSVESDRVKRLNV